MSNWEIIWFVARCAGTTFLLAAFTLLILSGISGVINWMDER